MPVSAGRDEEHHEIELTWAEVLQAHPGQSACVLAFGRGYVINRLCVRLFRLFPVTAMRHAQELFSGVARCISIRGDSGGPRAICTLPGFKRRGLRFSGGGCPLQSTFMSCVYA